MKAKSFFFCATLVAFAACSSDFSDGTESLPEAEEQDNGSSQSIFKATIEDGLRTQWAVGDKVKLLFDGETATVEATEAAQTSQLSGAIEGSFTDEKPLMAAFPADNVVGFDTESITVAIPNEQSATDNGYDNAAAVEVARTTTDILSFRNVGGGIKLNFSLSGVTKVELESVDGYPLSGNARITWDEEGNPVVGEIENANSIITFSAADASGFATGKDYFIATLPCDIYGGYRLSIYRDGLVADYFGVHQTIERAIFIAPSDLVESELEFDDPDAPLVEEERPALDATTKSLLTQYQANPTDANKQALLDQMGLRYDKVVARKKAKLRELEREAKTPDLVEEMQAIVDEMVENREIRLEQQFLRLIDPRNDDNPNDEWLVLRGASAPNAYIAYAPVTNSEYASFRPNHAYDAAKANYPVVNITIADAEAYCSWLTSKDSSHTYRLPTDEEWTLAAGHMPKDVAMNAGKVENGLTAVDEYKQTTGACGGIDFWGNCWEWTSSTDANGQFIVKGGAWDSDRDDCRTEKSDVVRTGTQGYDNVGFRVVRTEE